jgi:hypothetical protein
MAHRLWIDHSTSGAGALMLVQRAGGHARGEGEVRGRGVKLRCGSVAVALRSLRVRLHPSAVYGCTRLPCTL